MSRRIAIFGGSFNPPGLHHRRIADKLARVFDEVRVLPCGPRPDKPATTSIPSVYRAALAQITFGGIPRVTVDLHDLEHEVLTRNWQFHERFEREGEVWHVIGTDLIQGGAEGKSPIQKTWVKGRELWAKAKFAVLTRPDAPFHKDDLPPHHEVIELSLEGSSTDIRHRIGHGADIASLVTPRALAYIQRYGLYRAPIPNTWARGTLAGEEFLIRTDTRNTKAKALAKKLGKAAGKSRDPHFILTLGGDGAMLRCIREHWPRRLPFFGVNAGNLGFLMNRPEEVLGGAFPPGGVIFRQLPMLYLEFEDAQGRVTTAHGFNDAWVERCTSQSAWLEVTVNGVKRIPKLVSDGALVATAAGSTAYARSMGASPLLADTPAWLLVGSNVMEPAGWKSALLSTDSTVEIRCLDPKKRPVRAYVDGSSMNEVHSLRARISRAAAVELVFSARHDMAEKIAEIQFGE
jgi:NAD+ kinase